MALDYSSTYGLDELRTWYNQIRSQGGYGGTENLFELGTSASPEMRVLPTEAEYIAGGSNVAPMGYTRPFMGAESGQTDVHKKAAGIAYPFPRTENLAEIKRGTANPEATSVHEVLHLAFGKLRESPEAWADVTFEDPVDGETKTVQSVLYPIMSGSRDMPRSSREWNYLTEHDMVYSSDPRGPGDTVDFHEDYSERSGRNRGSKQQVLQERARRMLSALNDSVPFFPDTLQQSVNSFPGSPEGEPGLLSDKMSNEDWVQFIMGRGAEEERKTEVSKQKVEAKRQAQVKEVKEEKTKPSTVREAKAQGSLYFWDSKGNKKLALTAEDVKKFKASDKYDPEGKGALTQMANIGKKEGIEGLLTTAAPKAKDVEVPKAEKKGYNFRKNWEKYYYAGKPKGDEYMEGFQERLSSKKAIPDKAKEAIEIAVDIFGGDKDKNGKRYSADRLRKDLQNIGRVESQYRKKESTVGGTEKGWWQVKPSTAKDALENAKKHFGKKFNKHFKKHGGYDGLLDRAKKGTLAALMLKDEELAAAFAAVQIIRTFDQE